MRSFIKLWIRITCWIRRCLKTTLPKLEILDRCTCVIVRWITGALWLNSRCGGHPLFTHWNASRAVVGTCALQRQAEPGVEWRFYQRCTSNVPLVCRARGSPRVWRQCSGEILDKPGNTQIRSAWRERRAECACAACTPTNTGVHDVISPEHLSAMAMSVLEIKRTQCPFHCFATLLGK